MGPYLGGADRRFYTRMFSLDHERLRQSGKEILQAQDDVGQMLFSASAGIMGLRESLKAIGSFVSVAQAGGHYGLAVSDFHDPIEQRLQQERTRRLAGGKIPRLENRPSRTLEGRQNDGSDWPGVEIAFRRSWVSTFWPHSGTAAKSNNRTPADPPASKIIL